MKHYKEFEKEYIGSSDIASLTVRAPMQVETLDFLSDGEYDAYICSGNDVEIGNHYELVFTCKSWAKIYDDEGLVKELHGKFIDFYRAGSFGCIIHIHD